MNSTPADTERTHLRRVAETAGLKAEIVLPRHHHAVLGNRRFHYVEWGERDRPPLLFLHGGNQSARTWDAVCLTLADRYHCVALDQRGHGESEWSYEGHYEPAHHADDIAALVAHLGWTRFVLIGMSMGCINGLTYAARQPDSLTGFVAVDAGPFITMDGGRAIADFVQGNLAHPSLEGFVEAARRFNPKRRPELLRHSLTHTVRQQADGNWSWKADRRFKLDFDRMAANLRTLEDAAPSLACPALVMRGAQSPVMDEAQQRRFVDLLPDGHAATVPDAGHTIQGDNPKGFVDALQPFLNRLPGFSV